MTEVPFLILSAGRRVELARLFVKDTEALGLRPRFLAADLAPETSPACALADKAFRVPPATSSDYVSTLIEICRSEGVRLVVPTIDTELETLAAGREAFARVGVLLSISSPETVAIARDKLETQRHLATAGIETPRTALLEEVIANPSAWSWPVFAKPRRGSSSLGVTVAEDVAALRRISRARSDAVVQELLRGREYTINLFFTPDGLCRTAIPHYRREVRAGEVSKGIVIDDPRLRDVSQGVADSLPGAFGALCLQVMVDGDSIKVFEINARFGGGFPLAHRAGATFTRWLIELAAGFPCSAHNRWRDGTAMLRYDAAVFMDVPPGEPREPWLK